MLKTFIWSCHECIYLSLSYQPSNIKDQTLKYQIYEHSAMLSLANVEWKNQKKQKGELQTDMYFIQKIPFQNPEEVYEEIVKTEERKLRFFNSKIHKYKEASCS